MKEIWSTIPSALEYTTFLLNSPKASYVYTAHALNDWGLYIQCVNT